MKTDQENESKKVKLRQTPNSKLKQKVEDKKQLTKVSNKLGENLLATATKNL